MEVVHAPTFWTQPSNRWEMMQMSRRCSCRHPRPIQALSNLACCLCLDSSTQTWSQIVVVVLLRSGLAEQGRTTEDGLKSLWSSSWLFRLMVGICRFPLCPSKKSVKLLRRQKLTTGELLRTASGDWAWSLGASSFEISRNGKWQSYQSQDGSILKPQHLRRAALLNGPEKHLSTILQKGFYFKKYLQ